MNTFYKTFIHEHIFEEGIYQGKLWRKPENKKIKEEIKFLDQTKTFNQIVYDIVNDVDQPPICFCGEPGRFVSLWYGYSNFCCFAHSKNNPITLAKRIETTRERYGVDNISSHNLVKQKRQDTNLERYGVTCNLNSEQGISDKKATWMKNYGAENPMQNIQVFEKVFSSSKKLKKMTLPSGNVITYQGFENIVITNLLETYNEEDLVTRTNLPKITYIGIDNKLHRYYPDIFIPKENLIIEVKSFHTMYHIRHHETNLLKAKASVLAGYNFIFYICNNKEIIGKIPVDEISSTGK